MWSRDTGQRKACFDRCQLIIAGMSNFKEVNGKLRLYISFLEFGRHVGQLRRCRRAYAPTSNTTSQDNHEKINSWVSFIFPLHDEYGATLGGPSGHRSSAINCSNVWLPSMSCLRPIRTRVSVMCLCLDENDSNYSPLILCIEQMLVYNTGLIPSRFYEVLLDSDRASFKSIVITSSLLILGTALVSCKIGPLGILNYLTQTHINEALPGWGGGGGGSQVTCWNFKMSCVGIFPRVHTAVGN